MAKKAAAKKVDAEEAPKGPTPEELKAKIIETEKKLRTLQAEAFRLSHVPEDKEKAKEDARAARKKKYTTSNGLTVHKLRQAGHKVLVSHTRYVLQPTPVGTLAKAAKEVSLLQPCPSSLRKFVDFYPRGGQTYLHITTIDEKTIVVGSSCHIVDSFDYKLGVKKCLDSISAAVADDLLAPLEMLEAIESHTAVSDA